ncbi:MULTISPECIES: hypothetical protein [Phyllobacteriaceae]|jgi:hypothetical protein|uniref:hypothetical protein n=1 Tax=Phyllobacteriaceae TaxID=69277 RepID=UPI0011126A60|nr:MULTISPECIES: hypothetical protein [Mesorhizobium]MBN9237649.1 hypothetical protein [Mesorhizobium sp.]MDQ0331723.1 hypothetical protein [Mesorhizobium sp. YL-MeA3-2017]
MNASGLAVYACTLYPKRTAGITCPAIERIFRIHGLKSVKALGGLDLRFRQASVAGDFGRLERCQASKDLGSVTMPARLPAIRFPDPKELISNLERAFAWRTATTDMALLSAAIMAIACVAAIAATSVPTGAN